MFTDFRNEPAVLHQQELLQQAARDRIGRPDRMVRPPSPPDAGPWLGRVLRRLAGPAFA